MKLERIYYPYWEWEDYQHGMYSEDNVDRMFRVEKVIEMMSNPDTCRKNMKEVVDAWTKSAENTLTNYSINRIAWLGQAASCFYCGAHEDETREAWGLLTETVRNQANEIAKSIIKEWEWKQHGRESLFGYECFASDKGTDQVDV